MRRRGEEKLSGGTSGSLAGERDVSEERPLRGVPPSRADERGSSKRVAPALLWAVVPGKGMVLEQRHDLVERLVRQAVDRRHRARWGDDGTRTGREVPARVLLS